VRAKPEHPCAAPGAVIAGKGGAAAARGDERLDDVATGEVEPAGDELGIHDASAEKREDQDVLPAPTRLSGTDLGERSFTPSRAGAELPNSDPPRTDGL
jgi:hypothetical protein